MNRTDYEGMGREQLITRLMAAERVCLVYGWSGNCESVRSTACLQLWTEWYSDVPETWSGPEHHPELDDDALAMLAAKRETTRNATLKKFFDLVGDVGTETS